MSISNITFCTTFYSYPGGVGVKSFMWGFRTRGQGKQNRTGSASDGVGVQNFTRGLTPAGVGVRNSSRGFGPGRGRGQNCFVGVKLGRGRG